MSLLDEQPKRMAQEKRLLDALVQELRGLKLGGWSEMQTGELEVRFTLQVLSKFFDGVLVYPRYFPDVPAMVRPQRSGESWSSHQYLGSGVLCLERGPDNWDSTVTGADVVRSANKLLWCEAMHAVLPKMAPVASRHQLTEGQTLRYERRRFLVTTEFDRCVASASAGTGLPMLTARSKLGEYEVTLPTAVGRDEPQQLEGAPSLGGAEAGGGWTLAVSELPQCETCTLGDLASVAGWSPDVLRDKTVVMRDPAGGVRAFYVSTGDVVTELAVVDGRDDNAHRIPAENEKLRTLSIAVVGLGSLGSKIAVSLARSGARAFLLVDADVLLPHNLVRNDLDWREVGFTKANAVAERIRSVAPEAAAVAVPLEAAGQENSAAAASLAGRLGACDLVIDATADPAAFVMLAAICKRAKVPLIWGEVFAGGIGALMARSRPGLDADPLTVRSHIFGYLNTLPPVPRGDAKGYELEQSGKTLVAGDAEVSQLAAAMTAFAIDAACRAETSEYPVAAYLLGFKKFWEFKGPFDTIPVECPGAVGLEAEQALSKDEAAALDEIKGSVQRGAGAASDASV